MLSKQTAKREYQIYALHNQEKKIAFLGKSYAASLAPIYSKHVCGKNPYTNEYFGKLPPLVIPHLSVLTTITGTYRDAYRYLVAWTRMFIDADYTMIMQEGTVHYATALLPTTSAIYESIHDKSLEVILQQGLIAPSDTSKQNRRKEDKQSPERKCKSVQFNMRVFEDDMHAFVMFCDEHGLSRKDGFAFLLGQCKHIQDDQSSFAEDEIRLLKDRLAVQTQALIMAQDKVQKLSLSVQKDGRYKVLLNTVQSLLREYCEIALIDAEPFTRLKIGRYHNYPNVSLYTYPETEQDTQTIILEGLAYGKSGTPAIFIFARTLDSQMLKFRVYSKRDYVGVQIPGSAWMYLGAKWLVTWQRKCDGAIELTGSLPIPASLDTLVLDDYMRYQENNKKPSLDEVIRRANNK